MVADFVVSRSCEDFGEDVGQVVFGGDVVERDHCLPNCVTQPRESNPLMTAVASDTIGVGTVDGGFVVD